MAKHSLNIQRRQNRGGCQVRATYDYCGRPWLYCAAVTLSFGPPAGGLGTLPALLAPPVVVSHV
jgi:hypothetical protein